MRTPDWYALTLLALAAGRTTRLLGWDRITTTLRTRLTGYGDDGARAVRFKDGGWGHGPDRLKLAHFLHCPWCFGAWHCAAWWAAWQVWPHATLVAAAPWALSQVVGVVAKNLDP